jgi:hypothetical protein
MGGLVKGDIPSTKDHLSYIRPLFSFQNRWSCKRGDFTPTRGHLSYKTNFYLRTGDLVRRGDYSLNLQTKKMASNTYQ